VLPAEAAKAVSCPRDLLPSASASPLRARRCLQLTDIDLLQLSKYPVLNNFEKQTNVPKVYVVLGLGALYFFLVFFNIAADFLVKTIGFAIPAYYSLEALFTTKSSDDTQVSLSARRAGDPFDMRYTDICIVVDRKLSLMLCTA
jgi:hypothetical protein